MAKYLTYGNFVGDGIKGILKEGGSSRVAAIRKLFESAGGTLESYYFALGEYDYFIISDFPDNVSGESVALTVRASGLVTVKATVLMTPEEMDEVAKRSPMYRGPGQ